MKNKFKLEAIRRIAGFIAMIAIITLSLTALTMTGCETEYVEVQVQREILRGYISEYGKQIPIYQSVGIDDATAVTATASIISGYNGAAGGARDAASGKIQKIMIVSGTTASCTPDGVLSIGASGTYNWNQILGSFVVNAVN